MILHHSTARTWIRIEYKILYQQQNTWFPLLKGELKHVRPHQSFSLRTHGVWYEASWRSKDMFEQIHEKHWNSLQQTNTAQNEKKKQIHWNTIEAKWRIWAQKRYRNAQWITHLIKPTPRDEVPDKSDIFKKPVTKYLTL